MGFKCFIYLLGRFQIADRYRLDYPYMVNRAWTIYIVTLRSYLDRGFCRTVCRDSGGFHQFT